MPSLTDAPSFPQVIAATQALADAQRRGDRAAIARYDTERTAAIARCEDEVARMPEPVAAATETSGMQASGRAEAPASDTSSAEIPEKVATSENSSQNVDSVPAPTDRRKPYEPPTLTRVEPDDARVKAAQLPPPGVAKPKPAKPKAKPKAKVTTKAKPVKAAAKRGGKAKRRETIKTVAERQRGGGKKKPK